MVETKLVLASALLFLLSSCGENVSWRAVPVDGHISGVTAVAGNDTENYLGSIVDSVYHAPSGKTFTGGSTYGVASAIIGAQSSLSKLREVIGFCPTALGIKGENEKLFHWSVDVTRSEMNRISGKNIDIAVYNKGGIRRDLPQGNVMLDDIVSIYPFRNYLCYSEIKGEDLLWNLQEEKFRKIVVSSNFSEGLSPDGTPVFFIDGREIDENAWYRVACIDFLLDGGDGIYLARNARKVVTFPFLAKEMFEAYVRNQTSEGRSIEYDRL